ncbi:MAG: M20 family metallopeptidase [Proteobacteria bacterium]|nr:M20 family metallopeptidase [Pseudomonadota bacterium]MBI3496203.1 M20 family metallopeptidase [Pseudomonadota bacterium]
MSRDGAIGRATHYWDDGSFMRDLDRRVQFRTESQVPESRPQLKAYLADEIGPALAAIGYGIHLFDNPVSHGGPFLVAERIEDPSLPTVLTYGHGDVVRGLDAQWRQGLGPWRIVQEGERYYGRGTADNKAQHSINMTALAMVLAERGRLGFNSKFLLETSEEIGSPGLGAFCAEHKEMLAADLLIGSDGPRLAPDRPTIFMGTRGAFNFDLSVDLRAGGHHSGNWGGLLANPGVILAHALASIISLEGKVLVPDLVPRAIPNSVRVALADCTIDGGDDGPEIDAYWGEPGLTAAEKVFAWNTFEVLAFRTGNPENPVNAVPPRANAHCQIRFTVDTDPNTFIAAIRRHLDANGFAQVKVEASKKEMMQATRLDPDHPAARWAAASLLRTTGTKPAVLPNLGGSLPNEVFTDTLGLPTIWVPHSYAGCSQHAPNEHVLASLLREGLAIMTGLFWDMGEAPPRW